MSVVPGNTRMLRVEARNAATPREQKPEWIKTRARMGPEYKAVHRSGCRRSAAYRLPGSGVPEHLRVLGKPRGDVLIGGSQCTRRCDFCQIDTGKPADYDTDEPRRVAASVRAVELRYATVTGVARDDLPDEGAWLHAETVRQIHEQNPGTGVEILATDFSGNPDLLGEVFDVASRGVRAQCGNGAQNLQTDSPSLSVRPLAGVLSQARDAGLIAKSNLILGMGETTVEVHEALRDLFAAGCHIVALTQLLRPSPRHLPVARWVHPEEFVELKQEAESLGFLGVLAGPLVRSSYRAGRLWAQSMQRAGRPITERLAALAEDRGFSQAVG